MASNSGSSRRNDEVLRIVMVGKTGVGKSASGNMILGRQCFKSKSSFMSTTVDCAKGTGEVDGQRVAIIDTPGLFDTRFDSTKTAKDLCQCITHTAPGPHVFLVVIRLGRFTEEEKQTVQNIEEIFGQAANQYSMVLFTGGDLMEDTTMEESLGDCPELQELVYRCNGQYHVFNNKLKDRSQVTELLQKIRNIVQKNGGSHYTNEMFQEAERAIKEKTDHILKEKEEQMQREKEELERKIQEKYENQMKKIQARLQADRAREKRERDEERRERDEERMRERDERRERDEERRERDEERRQRDEERMRERDEERRERDEERRQKDEERMRERDEERRERDEERRQRDEERMRERDEERKQRDEERKERDEERRQRDRERDEERKQRDEERKERDEERKQRDEERMREKQERMREKQEMAEERKRLMEEREAERKEKEREMKNLLSKINEQRERELREQIYQLQNKYERGAREEAERFNLLSPVVALGKGVVNAVDKVGKVFGSLFKW